MPRLGGSRGLNAVAYICQGDGRSAFLKCSSALGLLSASWSLPLSPCLAHPFSTQSL